MLGATTDLILVCALAKPVAQLDLDGSPRLYGHRLQVRKRVELTKADSLAVLNGCGIGAARVGRYGLPRPGFVG